MLGERRPVALADHDLLAEFDPEAREAVIAAAERAAGSLPAIPDSAEQDALLAILSGRVGDVGDGGIVSRLDGDAGATRSSTTSGVAFTRDALVALERERPEAVIGLWRALAAWMAPPPVLEEAL